MSNTHDVEKFHKDLVTHQLIIPTDVKGCYGRGAIFEDVLHRFDALVTQTASDDGAEEMNFPPILPRSLIETLGYMDNFPQLAGSVHSFAGDERQAHELSERLRQGKRWEDLLEPTQVMLTPAACYPVYPLFSGLLPAGGRLVTLHSWVYRHEPSDEPTRLQSFRVREYVRVGAPDVVVQWRDTWLQRGLKLLQALGLPAKSDVASDPFFGRIGKMMAADQTDQRLKFEILTPVISIEKPTAVCSFNWHQDHFSSKFGICQSDTTLAHTACLGFGLERVTLALIKTHGFEPKKWPDAVRSQLWS